MSISAAQALVRAFHQRFGVANPDRPSLPQSLTTIWRRERWISEELDELHEAMFVDDDAQSLADAADAYIDIIYFALGGLVELGIDSGPLFDAVHAANMAKVKLPGVAKITKPEGWKAPDIAGLIEEQRQRTPYICYTCKAPVYDKTAARCPLGHGIPNRPDIDRRMAGK